MLLLCSLFRLKEFQVKNGRTMLFLFFFLFIEMPKIWVEMDKKKSMAQDKGGLKSATNFKMA